MYSYGPPHMAEQKQDDQLEHTYSSYVRIRDVALKTCQRRWTIGRNGERGSGISMLAARHDDDEEYIKRGVLKCWTGFTNDLFKFQAIMCMVSLSIGSHLGFNALSHTSLHCFKNSSAIFTQLSYYSLLMSSTHSKRLP